MTLSSVVWTPFTGINASNNPKLYIIQKVFLGRHKIAVFASKWPQRNWVPEASRSMGANLLFTMHVSSAGGAMLLPVIWPENTLHHHRWQWFTDSEKMEGRELVFTESGIEPRPFGIPGLQSIMLAHGHNDTPTAGYKHEDAFKIMPKIIWCVYRNRILKMIQSYNVGKFKNT